jgi:hypothetical protein
LLRHRVSRSGGGDHTGKTSPDDKTSPPAEQTLANRSRGRPPDTGRSGRTSLTSRSIANSQTGKRSQKNADRR